jgi:DNA-binding response OmpR family regulator
MSAALNVLLIEDNDQLSENLFEFMEPHGVVMDRAADGLSGLHLAVTQAYDVIVLDLMLPGISGIEVCRRLRAQAGHYIPVLMLTSMDAVADKLAGFAAGADDYLIKPFDLSELEARLRVLAQPKRRSDSVLKVGELSFNTGTLCADRAGRPLSLTRAGERLLQTLMRAYPNVVRKQELERALWADEPPDSDTLRTHIHAVRRAIDGDFEHKMLLTLHRYGYRLLAEGDRR